MQRIAIRQSDRIIRERKRQVLTWGILIAIFMVFSYTFVWQRVKTLELAEQHSLLQRSVYDLKAKCRSFEYDINQLSSVQRIDQFAREQLSMMPADKALLAAATISSSKNSPKPPTDAVAKIQKDSLLAVASTSAGKSTPKPSPGAVTKSAKSTSVVAQGAKKSKETHADKKSADVIAVKQGSKKETKSGSGVRLISSGTEGVLLASLTPAPVPELMSSYDPSAMPVVKKPAQVSKKNAVKSSGKSSAKSAAKPTTKQTAKSVSSGSKSSPKNNGKSSQKNSVTSSKTKSTAKNGKVAG